MERSEPALVPQWLKAANGGTAANSNSNNGGLSPNAEKSSAYRRSVSSNGLGVEKDSNSRHYANFGRSHRNRDPRTGFHENDRQLKMGSGYDDRSEKNMSWQSRYTMQGSKINGGSPTRISGGGPVQGNSFERDFPSLVAEEKQADTSRISSPRYYSASHVGSSIIGTEGWTSALVDIPSTVGGNASLALPGQLPAPLNVPSVPAAASTGLNMAETLAKAPLRAHSAPTSAMETQKLEELAIRQSKQLIPVTPTASKPLASSITEKLKPKARTGEVGGSLKSSNQPSSHSVNHVRGPIKSDISKPSQVGNFHVLNREKNGFSSNPKDVVGTNAYKTVSGHGSSPSAVASMMNPGQLKLKTDMFGPLSVAPMNLAERKAAQHSKDRNDFFNALRKKTPAKSATSELEQSSISSPVLKKPVEEDCVEVVSALPDSESSLSDNGSNCSVIVDSGDDANNNSVGLDKTEKDVADIVDLTEEEKRFLISLGWEENMGCKPLTAEEIDAFLTKHNLLSSKHQNDEAQQSESSEAMCSTQD